MSTLELTLHITFPAEWLDNDEHGTLILVEQRRRKNRRLEIPFTLPGGFPRQAGQRRHTHISHQFSDDIRPTETLVDGPGPWAMRPLDDTVNGMNFLRGDGLELDLTLSAY